MEKELKISNYICVKEMEQSGIPLTHFARVYEIPPTYAPDLGENKDIYSVLYKTSQNHLETVGYYVLVTFYSVFCLLMR